MLTLISSVVAALGGLALLLAAVGVYGVMMYVVAQRTHEFGIRMALGAAPRQILQSTLWEGVRLVGWGVILGGSFAIALATMARTWAMGVSPVDPPTLAAVSGLLALVALVACWIPARQATRVDPMVALRCD
jgi:putative ABC transport system permease protein